MTTTIIQTKSFHHNNLILQLNHDTLFDIYTITILQVNTNQIHDFFGLFLDIQSATTKFNSITL